MALKTMGQSLLCERFNQARIDPRLRWFNPPAYWKTDPVIPALILAPDPNTLFWQNEAGGESSDTGHFLHVPVTGNFVLSTTVSVRPQAPGDQAGLMIRYSPRCWLKVAVEYRTEGPCHLASVVTNQGCSDWAAQPYPRRRRIALIRISHHNGIFLVESSEDGSLWMPVRRTALVPDSPSPTAEAGLFACSPTLPGLTAEFQHLTLESSQPSPALFHPHALRSAPTIPPPPRPDPPPRDSDLLSTTAVADLLLLRPSLVAKQAREGLLPGAVQIDGRWFIPRSSIALILRRKSGRRAPK